MCKEKTIKLYFLHPTGYLYVNGHAKEARNHDFQTFHGFQPNLVLGFYRVADQIRNQIYNIQDGETDVRKNKRVILNVFHISFGVSDHESEVINEF